MQKSRRQECFALHDQHEQVASAASMGTKSIIAWRTRSLAATEDGS